jgi:glycosyltransferase involved in cell wall biosynthesis
MAPHFLDARPSTTPTARRQRRATSGSAAPPGVLILNWRDTANPAGGGSELYVERVAAGLAAQGRPVTLVCAAHPRAPAREQAGGVRILRRGGKLGVYPWAFLLHLTRRVGPHDVVVDVQNGLPFFAALWCRKPVIVLVHHVHREQWRVVLPGPLAALGWWVESWLSPRLYRWRGARYVTVSEATREELVALGVRPAAVTVVHNGVEQPAGHAGEQRGAGRGGPVASGAAPSCGKAPEPTICVLGRLVPHKRVEYALEAAARIRAELPRLKVLVVGQGHWEPKLREAVARLGLEGTVELLGFVSEQAKQEILARSWVLAMPSLKEGWGLAVLEAATHATPAVAFRGAGGVVEAVLDGETGLLARDQEEFTELLLRLLRDRALRERLGAAARERSREFSWSRTVAAFSAVIEAAVAETGTRRRRRGAEPQPGLPTVTK